MVEALWRRLPLRFVGHSVPVPRKEYSYSRYFVGQAAEEMNVMIHPEQRSMADTGREAGLEP